MVNSSGSGVAEIVVSPRYFFTMSVSITTAGTMSLGDCWELEHDMGAGKMAVEKNRSGLGAWRVQSKQRMVTRKLCKVYKHLIMGQYMKRGCISLPKLCISSQ